MSELPGTQQPAGLTTTSQSQPLSEHPVAVYLAGLSASSRRTGNDCGSACRSHPDTDTACGRNRAG